MLSKKGYIIVIISNISLYQGKKIFLCFTVMILKTRQAWEEGGFIKTNRIEAVSNWQLHNKP